MKLTNNNLEVTINTLSNWPLVVDLFSKWGYDVDKDSVVELSDIDKYTSELSAWGIPWTRTKWNHEQF